MSVMFEGHVFDPRTVLMIKGARVICPAPMIISQGSYSNAAASAGTHSGGGAVDIHVSNRTPAERKQIVSCMRRVGFAAWLRTPAQANWPYHVHGIAIGCKDLSPSAAAQVVDYRDDRNGLASDGKDDGPRDWVDVTWEKFIATNDDVRLEIGMALSQEALNQIKAIIPASVSKSDVEEIVQRYTLGGEKYLSQMVDDIGKYAALATDSALKDDFAKVQSQLSAIAAKQNA